MKKVALIIFAVLVVLLVVAAGGGAIAYKKFNSEYGLAASPVLHHDAICEADTRIRLVAAPLLVAPFVEQYLPENMEIPTGPFSLQSVLDRVLPREVAALIKTDMNTRKAQLTLFANEQRLGPYLEKVLNDSAFLAKIKQISWTSNGFELPERGSLSARGTLTVPETVESELFERWPTRVRETPAAVQGGHLLELVIDNRNGDILALAAAGVSASGQDWATFRKSQEAEMAMGVIQAIEVARITADLVDPDSAAFDLRIEADEKGGPGLQFLLSGLAIPFATDYLKNEMGLALTGDLKWNAAEKAITGRYTLSGLKAVLRQQLAKK